MGWGGTKGREEASFCERVKLGMENEANRRRENVSLFSLLPFPLFLSSVIIREKEKKRKKFVEKQRWTNRGKGGGRGKDPIGRCGLK